MAAVASNGGELGAMDPSLSELCVRSGVQRPFLKLLPESTIVRDLQSGFGSLTLAKSGLPSLISNL
jgi:hypothetical protein